MKRITLSLVLLLFLSPTHSWAWRKTGHDLVAEVAFRYLDGKTQKNVLHYLNGMTIEEAATWMDDMRKNPTYDFMKPYHYVNFEKGIEVTPLEGDNIINTLNAAMSALDHKETLSNEDIKIKLCYLFHLIGDLHQPLHVGYGEDHGGNKVHLTYASKHYNLHDVWDDTIIESKGMTLEQVLKSKTYSKTEVDQIQKIDVISWAKESRSFLDTVYGYSDETITQEYVDTNYKLIENRILLAGIRLAGVLKQYFG